MYRAIPTGNKLLQKKWADKDREIHMNKLKDIKAQVEIREPTQFRHLKKKMKKTQMLEDRYTEIERENRILLEKMTSIMQNNRTAINTANAAMQSTQTTLPIFNKRSLNREARKRELLKITMENQAILKRLQDKQPNYNVFRWQEENEERRKILKNICEYPYQIDTSAAGVQMASIQSKSQTNYNSGPPEFIIKKKGPLTTMPFYKKKGYADQQQQQQDDNQMRKELQYQGHQDLGNGIYQIEIFIAQGGELIISAQHSQRNDSFVIEIQQDKVEQLMNEFKGDFMIMAEHLKIMNKRMVLLNPKFARRESKSVSPDKSKVFSAGEEGQQQQPRSISNIEERSPLKSDSKAQDLNIKEDRAASVQSQEQLHNVEQHEETNENHQQQQ